VAIEAERPLGLVFEERKRLNISTCVVEEIVEGSTAAKAGAKVGDVLRLVSAVIEMRDKVRPAWCPRRRLTLACQTDVVGYYLNPSPARVRRAILITDRQPFVKVMKALMSNGQPVDLPPGDARGEKAVLPTTLLVLERPAAS